MTIIIISALSPVMLTCSILLAATTLIVTKAIDRPIERASLSKREIFGKKISVQAKPGKKNTRTEPIRALNKENCSSKDATSPICFSCLVSPYPEAVALNYLAR